MVSWYLRYLVILRASRLSKRIMSVLSVAPEPRVIEKKSLKAPAPSIVKSSTRNVLEIRSLSVAKNVTPISPRVSGRSVFAVMTYRPRLRVLGVAGRGPGGHPVILGFTFLPDEVSMKVELDVALL